MRIAFDYQIFAAQQHGGVSRYFTSLVRELSLLGERPRVIAPIHSSGYLHELPGLVSGRRWDRFLPPKNHLIQPAINRLMTRALMSRFAPDLVHETYYSPRATGPRGTPTVITVFDMIHELFPGQFPPGDRLTEFKRAAVQRADHVICISENTRDDLVRLFDVPRDRVSVTQLAADDPTPVYRDSSGSFPGDEGPFLLYVGVRWGYKNFDGLLTAFAGSPSLRKEFRIVAFGGGALTPDENATVAKLGLTGRVLHLSGDTGRLDALYKRAFALVYPSIYEGFGLPPLEAMARGCPVIASNTSSMPEVIGDAGELFDPADPGAMMRSIEAVANSDDYRRALVGRGARRVKDFSWRRCAEETRAVYRSVTAS